LFTVTFELVREKIFSLKPKMEIDGQRLKQTPITILLSGKVCTENGKND
jgi:hypothetical protein